MATDEEALINTLLTSTWIAGNVAMPRLIYLDDVKTATPPFIKIYYTHSDPIKPRGIGYPGKSEIFHLTLDVRSTSRENLLKIRDEIIRVLDAKRIQPSSSIDYITYDSGSKINSYVGFFRWNIKVNLVQIYRNVGGI